MISTALLHRKIQSRTREFFSTWWCVSFRILPAACLLFTCICIFHMVCVAWGRSVHIDTGTGNDRWMKSAGHANKYCTLKALKDQKILVSNMIKTYRMQTIKLNNYIQDCISFYRLHLWSSYPDIFNRMSSGKSHWWLNRSLSLFSLCVCVCGAMRVSNLFPETHSVQGQHSRMHT